MTPRRWLVLARSRRVETGIRKNNALADFQAIVRVAECFPLQNWDEAVALLHMVYGWMPTMLRAIQPHTAAEKRKLVRHLRRGRDGCQLTRDELIDVKFFANGSIVGASKLLHVIRPDYYAIWDARVARRFFGKKVARATFATVARYEEYLQAIRCWAKQEDVIAECQRLRELDSELRHVSDLRMIELVMFIK